MDTPGSQDEPTPAAKPRKAEADKKQKPAPHKTAKHQKTDEHRRSADAVPRTTFEDRTAHYFDPLSLTLAPESRIDPADTHYDTVQGKFEAPDTQQVAGTPDDSRNAGATSAGIENMGMGHNMTVVVPLFQILNQLSPGPAQQ